MKIYVLNQKLNSTYTSFCTCAATIIVSAHALRKLKGQIINVVLKERLKCIEKVCNCMGL